MNKRPRSFGFWPAAVAIVVLLLLVAPLGPLPGPWARLGIVKARYHYPWKWILIGSVAIGCTFCTVFGLSSGDWVEAALLGTSIAVPVIGMAVYVRLFILPALASLLLCFRRHARRKRRERLVDLGNAAWQAPAFFPSR